MARQSAASLSIVRGGAPKGPPPAPRDLSAAEKRLWTEVVESKPADWFGADSLPVLKEYVRAATTCDLLAKTVQRALKEGDDAGIKAALDMRDKEAKRAVSLATKLRLTPQSRYTSQSAATANARAGGRRPWQI